MNDATYNLIAEVMQDEISTETPCCQHIGCQSSTIRCKLTPERDDFYCHTHAITYGFCTCCGEYVNATEDKPFCVDCNSLAI